MERPAFASAALPPLAPARWRLRQTESRYSSHRRKIPDIIGRHEKRSALARPLGNHRPPGAADLAAQGRGPGRRRNCRLRLYRAFDGASAGRGGSEGRRARGGRDRLRRRGAQRRPGQRRHVACARRDCEEARRRLWRAVAQAARRRPGGGLRHGREARDRLRIGEATARCTARLDVRASPRSRSVRGNGALAARR